MNTKYKAEQEAMRVFYDELGIIPDYSCNTDGRVKGTLVEFKLTNPSLPIKQLKRYIDAYNAVALPIPRYSLFIYVNGKEFAFIDNTDWEIINDGFWEQPEDLLNYLDMEEYMKGWIDEYSIVAYNDKFYKNHLSAAKEDFIREIENPKELYIEPYRWNDIGDMERSILDCLGSVELKKRLGAFFTPDEYVEISKKYLRNAIARVPEGHDYIILDRCAGTGNLEKFLTNEELSHCILNTYVYAEWTTLKGLYEGRVRYIIPHNNDYKDCDGLLSDGDALTERFNKTITDIIDKEIEAANGKLVVIGLENPPYAEPGAKTNSGLKTTGSYINIKMKKDKSVRGRASTDLANQFIWSMTRGYADEYIVFAPIKYWKSQHLFDGEFNEGYLCDKKLFRATQSAISLISWTISDLLQNKENVCLKMQSDLGDRDIKKLTEGINYLVSDSTKNKKVAEVYFYNGEPNFLNGVLCNTPMNKNACYRILGEDNLFNVIPLWVANCYKPKDYTEKGVIMKSGDGGLEYQKDKDFLDDCFVWSCLTNANKCVSNEHIKNELCLGQGTKADKLFGSSSRHNELLKKWTAVLKLAKGTEEYNSEWTYGLHQIIKDMNIKVDSGDCNKKGEPIMIHKYDELNEAIKELKIELNEFYEEYIADNLFKYELLK